ncbi:hypothetical protein [Siphonobacter curvatus]|uniref:hypothetical protein n=1 Tax=Siphonobacter curvatus TaxID=2094562 RepID=UPI001FAFBFAB|nr:hypothetical protein [Siphonobacter curvatus]
MSHLRFQRKQRIQAMVSLTYRFPGAAGGRANVRGWTDEKIVLLGIKLGQTTFSEGVNAFLSSQLAVVVTRGM